MTRHAAEQGQRPARAPADIEIHPGLPPSQRGAAARLYWQAFGGKLGRVLGPEERALRYLDRVIRADHVLTAWEADGRLAGLAGFRSWAGGFASGTAGDLAAVYGRAGAAWRAGALRLLTSDVDNRRFLIDGICVRADCRGRGIGSALLDALSDLARSRGYDEIRLDVVDSNPRARALYRRHGYAEAGTDRIGPLALLFGFRSSTRMVRALT
ncbi:GNAT family N-acetyltransferase [Acidimangrovimonas pyrenivorans]|uniref:GNAT family N-acetyltransferase n=1 Tax=Acidimangrovimonas pyrenivorans TaxID=2030798 RepID=A0ABV7ABD4_9RHOB